MSDFSWLIDKLYIIPGIFIGLSFHEFSHALSAYLMGDDTARKAGRLTIDPIRHIDPLGFISLLIAGFGWAKPVPIDPWRFKNRRLGTIIVSLAGPFMNLLLSFITLSVLYALDIWDYNNEVVFKVVFEIFRINIVLCIFNLLPIPPLDGSKVLASVLPSQLEDWVYRLERYSYIILMALVFTRTWSKILGPPVMLLIDMVDYAVYHMFLFFNLL